MEIKQTIGDYSAFFSNLIYRLKRVGVDVAGMPISHFTYRTATVQEYEQMRDRLKTYCKEFVETQFNGRAVSILVLKTPLALSGGSAVPVIELPAPRPVHVYPSGLESIGIVIGDKLPEFNEQHKMELTGIKNHGKHCKPSFITFENSKTVKFYDAPLLKIVELQGWRLGELQNTTPLKTL